MAVSNSHITILTLNVNGLNTPIKRHRLANWIKKPKPIGVLYPGNPSHSKDTQRLKIKGWRRFTKQMESKKKQE